MQIELLRQRLFRMQSPWVWLQFWRWIDPFLVRLCQTASARGSEGAISHCQVSLCRRRGRISVLRPGGGRELGSNAQVTACDRVRLSAVAVTSTVRHQSPALNFLSMSLFKNFGVHDYEWKIRHDDIQAQLGLGLVRLVVTTTDSNMNQSFSIDIVKLGISHQFLRPGYERNESRSSSRQFLRILGAHRGFVQLFNWVELYCC
ncbi:hypothetical protein BJ912DRAFT_955146 [Pholiota molesta]|nr:hypothetical protein BJ912DRAFT_955146 [Pholiota molesta]